MKLALKLAYKNLMGAGMRTWLNVGVLSFSFIIILFYNGWIDGWKHQAVDDLIKWEYGEGQLVHHSYDPLDVFSLKEANAKLPEDPQLSPVLVQQASIYPEGRMIPVLLKGIDQHQTQVAMPTQLFETNSDYIPALIGHQMAKSAKLDEGDELVMRWRDAEGTFDAATVQIVGVFESTVFSIDGGQIWIPIDKLWEMTNLTDHATYALVDEDFTPQLGGPWEFRSQDDLLAELNEIIAMEKTSGSVMYLLLLGIALLAIFDTQVLSVFRRQKEIGTFISLGMTRWQVVGMFTIEGGMNAVFASVLGAVYGTPLLLWVSKVGIGMPYDSSDVGITVAEIIYPVFSLQLVIITVVAIVISATIVSFLPSRRIAKMDPVQALKGKIQ